MTPLTHLRDRHARTTADGDCQLTTIGRDSETGLRLEDVRVLYEEHAPALYTLAARLTGSREDGEDIVQEVFLGLPKTLTSYRGDGPIDAWLRSIIARRALGLLRKRKRRRELDYEIRVPGSAHSVDKPIDRLWLENALLNLPEPLRLVLVLRMHGYSHAEIAAELDIAPQTSMGRLTRGKALLREALR